MKKVKLRKENCRQCHKCKKDLDFAADILANFVACPYCGSFLKNLLPIEPGSVAEKLQQTMDDFGGAEIFSEENCNRLQKILHTWSAPFDDARDKLLIASIRKIPQRLYAAVEIPEKEQQREVFDCEDSLKSMGLSAEVAEEIVSWFVAIFKISGQNKIKQKPVIKKIMGSVTNVWDEEESTYPTCQIGNLIWFAKNFENYIPYSGGRTCDIEIAGRYYDFSDAANCAPEGWRLPSREDFLDTFEYIKSLGLDVGTSLKAKTNWSGTGCKGTDDFGYSVFPSLYDDTSNEEKIRLWTSSKINSDSVYIVTFSADSNDYSIEESPIDGYIRCVRYVKDA